jgi:hypothetical protein
MHKARGESWRKNVKKAFLERIKNLENHPRYKGDAIGYFGVHSWIEKVKGKPKRCEICGIEDKKKKYHWANKDGRYRRREDEWMRVCVSCHRIYDYKQQKNNKITNNKTP